MTGAQIICFKYKLSLIINDALNLGIEGIYDFHDESSKIDVNTQIIEKFNLYEYIPTYID